MAINNESLNRKLYGLLKVKGYNPVPKDSSGQTTPVPDEAEVFKFTFTRGGQAVGDVWITIDSSQNLVIYYDDEVADEDENTGAGGADFNDSWTGLIQHLKNWAQRRQLSFELKNKNHLSSDMAQRAHTNKEERAMESTENKGTTLTEAQNAQQKYLQIIRKYKLVQLVQALVTKLQKKSERSSDPDLKPMYASDARQAATVLNNLKRGNIRGARIAFARQDTAARDEFFAGRYTDDGWSFPRRARALAVVLGTGLNRPNIDDEDDTIDTFLKEKAVGEHVSFAPGSYPDVDHMPGKRYGVNLPSAPAKPTSSKRMYAEKAKWGKDINEINAALYDDNAEFISDIKGVKVVVDGRTVAEWSNASQKGYIDAGSMTESRKKIDSKKKDPYGFDDDGKRGKGPTGKTRTAKATAAKKVEESYPGQLKCIRKGCNKDAMDGSNYCSPEHRKASMRKSTNKEKVEEGYYPMGKKASYSDNVPSVKIILQHTRQIEEGEQRYRNIAKIFLENSNGERILAPTTKPGIARIYARHLAEGGLPHNDRWNHIGTLIEEYTKMAGFVRATRTGQFNESAQALVKEGINHYNNLRESLNALTTHRGYNAYFESWTPVLTEESDDSDTTLTELFVQEKLDPRIECVMPILSKLHKRVTEMSEVNELSDWANAITEDESLTSNNPQGIPETTVSENPNKVTDKTALKVKELAIKFFKREPYSSARIANGTIHRLSIPIGGWLSDNAGGLQIDRPGSMDKISAADKKKMANLRTGFLKLVEKNGIPAGKVDVKFHVGSFIYASIRTQIAGQRKVNEGAMAEADMIIQDILNGRTELYTIMNRPVGKVELYVSQILKDMYADQAIEHGLHQDDDFEKIEQRMMDQLDKEYGRREQFDLTEAPVDRTKYNTWEEFKKGAADRGLEIEGPYADVENGPSADDPYESTMVKDASGDYIGMYWHDGEVSSQGVIFNNADDFYRWQNEGDQDTPDADPGDMDGDHDSAMRDAGMGTDEDYGTPADEMFEEMRKLAGLQEAKKKDKKKDSKEEAARKKRKAEEEGRDLAYAMDGGRQQHSWGMGDDGRNRQ